MCVSRGPPNKRKHMRHQTFQHVDREALATDLRRALKEARPDPRESSAHLATIRLFTRTLGVVAVLSMWLPTQTIVPWLSMSLYLFSKWTMLAHHILHGGYEPAIQRGTYARPTTFRRIVDWLDWMSPDAWDFEHNHLHHYNLSETTDPDLVEHRFEHIRKLPSIISLVLIVLPVMLTWKWSYYASNTYHHLLARGRPRENVARKPPTSENEVARESRTSGSENIFWRFMLAVRTIGIPSYLRENSARESARLLLQVMAPHFAMWFLLLPSAYYVFFLAISTPEMALCVANRVVANVCLGELVTNIHSFVVITPNHTGPDLYRFSSSCVPNSGEFYLRQIIASANFTSCGPVSDFLQGYLNYQVEHHLFPKESMLCVRCLAPRVRAICDAHNIPYIRQNVFWRFLLTVGTMVGICTMKKYDDCQQ